MNKLAQIAAATAIAATTTIALASPAGAAPAKCELVAQPWDGRSYALTAVVDGEARPLITRQSGVLDGQTSWTFDAGSITEVWWAAKDPARQTAAADFYDVMPVEGCRFTVAYHATPGKPDSVIIDQVEAATPEPTTTTTPPPPTSTVPPVAPPSTIVQRETPTPTPEAPPVVTTLAPPPVDVPLVEAPPTTAPVSPPSTAPVPSTSTTIEVDLFTATSVEAGVPTLPNTGVNTKLLGLAGLNLVLIGTFLVGLPKLRNARIAATKEGRP